MHVTTDINACQNARKHMQKPSQTHDNAYKRTQTHVKMLINYVKFHTNTRKYIYMHTKIHKRI